MAKNESKFASGAKQIINGCDYWGTYKGYDVYRCYRKRVPSEYMNIVFASGNNLYMNGTWIGYVNDGGTVTSWEPERAVKKVEPVKFEGEPVDVSKCADEILSDSWKRSVEDLIGEKFSVDIKYSE